MQVKTDRKILKEKIMKVIEQSSLHKAVANNVLKEISSKFDGNVTKMKEELETEIKDLLNEFRDSTGISIDEIDIWLCDCGTVDGVEARMQEEPNT